MTVPETSPEKLMTESDCNQKHKRLWGMTFAAIGFLGIAVASTWIVVESCYLMVTNIHEDIKRTEEEINEKINETNKKVVRIDAQMPFVLEGIGEIKRDVKEQRRMISDLHTQNGGGF